MSAPTIRQLGDQLDEAFVLFLDGERDGTAWVAAYDTREEGYDLAQEAFWKADRDGFIEAELDKLPGGPCGSYAGLVSSACAFRLAELDAELAREAA